MYNPHEVLRQIDAHATGVLVLCGMAMAFNYAYFFDAVRKGFKDQAYPIPVFCTLFWLAGDSSMLFHYHLVFNVYDHWYLKCFWFALVLTVGWELMFLYMTLRFGRAELAQSWSQSQFTTLIAGGLALTLIAWYFIQGLIGDDLFINYFHLANFAGPPFAAALTLRRKSRAGTTPFIWLCYTGMVACWFTASALWFGDAFRSPIALLLYAGCTLSAAMMILAVRRLPEPSRGSAVSDRIFPEAPLTSAA
jgi:hypothetical protein